MFSRLVTALIPLLLSTVHAFTFSADTPTQCDNFTITWTGGQAPFGLLLIPRYGTPRNLSIPVDAFSNGQGTLTTQLALPENQEFLITMSDSTGFGSGGTSPLLTVGPPVSGTNCNTTDPGTSFTFSLPNALQQCSSYSFTEYNNAIQPVTIYGLIPDGQSIVLSPPLGPSYEWPSVDIASGTSVIFVMVDAEGRQGGSSDLEIIQANNDASCLNAQSPSSTASPFSTSTSTSTSTNNAPTATKTAAAKLSIGAIAGTILGAIVLIAVVVTMGLFFLKKCNDKRHAPYGDDGITGAMTGYRQSQRIASTDISGVDSPNPTGRPYGHGSGLHTFAYPAPHSATAPPLTPTIFMPQSGPHEPNPFLLPASTGRHTRHSSKAEPLTPITPTTDGGVSPAQRQKAGLAGEIAYRPSRFIVHTDVEEASSDVEEVFELPPQYADRRPNPPTDVKRQPSGSVQRHPSSSVQRQHSSGVRRRPSGNVPSTELPSLFPISPALSPPPSQGRF